jgi:hypothetical protein
MTQKLYVAYFDCLGFECILDYSNHDKKKIWNALQDKPNERFPLPQMMLRAQFNPQRSPEIWSFWSEIDLATLREYARDMPQQLADSIRENGTSLYTSPKQKQVIQ